MDLFVRAFRDNKGIEIYFLLTLYQHHVPLEIIYHIYMP